MCTIIVLFASAIPAGSAGASLDPDLPWYGENRERLDAFIDTVGAGSPDYDRRNKPVAIFDWDNTVVKNDIGDGTFFWMLRNDKVLQPPGRDWSRTSRYLTAAARESLSAACDTLAQPGKPLPTSTDVACADAILAVYYDGTTVGGETAFASWDYRQMEPSYAWAAHLQAGYSPGQVRSFAVRAFAENERAPIGATQVVGSRTVNGYIRIYEQIKDLIVTMQVNGFDVWVVTASPQDVVAAISSRVRVAPHHVIGIRSLLDARQKLTYDLQGCGTVPDGENSQITYIEGKRCWINKVIYGDATASAGEQRPAHERPVFGAGDSDTDITFLKDATMLKLAINRNRLELMCNAYSNAGERWLINPMFIAPRGPFTSGYPCSTTACRSPSGARVPCLDEDGNPIADQLDTVFG